MFTAVFSTARKQVSSTGRVQDSKVYVWKKAHMLEVLDFLMGYESYLRKRRISV
jgi:hypothetical protein